MRIVYFPVHRFLQKLLKRGPTFFVVLLLKEILIDKLVYLFIAIKGLKGLPCILFKCSFIVS